MDDDLNIQPVFYRFHTISHRRCGRNVLLLTVNIRMIMIAFPFASTHMAHSDLCMIIFRDKGIQKHEYRI